MFLNVKMDKETATKFFEDSMRETMQILEENLQETLQGRPKELFTDLFSLGEGKDCEDRVNLYLNQIRDNTMATLQKVLDGDEEVIKRMEENGITFDKRTVKTTIQTPYCLPIVGVAALNKMAAEKLNKQLKNDKMALDEKVAELQKKILVVNKSLESVQKEVENKQNQLFNAVKNIDQKQEKQKKNEK